MDHDNDRREFLRISVTLTSGLAAPFSLNGCGRDQAANPQQTFVQPPILEAKNGVLDVTLTASYFTTVLSAPDRGRPSAVSLRAYGHDATGPHCCGPTLVIRGGDQLRIKLVNQLPVNPPVLAFRDPTNYMKPNTTNLHVHGLHVFPGIDADKHPPEYGDYVVDPNIGGVLPRGGTRQYVYHLPPNHPAGPFYYHPQYHGSSAIQVASLMAGAILVRGAVDDLPEMAQAEERVFLFQAPYFSRTEATNNEGVTDGALEKFSQIAVQPTGHGVSHADFSAAPVLINGVRQPTMVMVSGEVQRWRFINTQAFNSLNLNLDGHTLRQYTADGWGSADFQDFPDAQSHGKGLVLAAGNRSSVMVKAGAPGTYWLRTLPLTIAQTAAWPGDILAKLVVIAGDGKPQKNRAMPATPLPVSEFLKPITDEEWANAGGKKRSIIFNMLGNAAWLSRNKAPSLVHRTVTAINATASAAHEQIKQKIAEVLGQPGQAPYIAPNPVPNYEYQLQPSNTMTQTVILGAVEEWTVFNCNGIPHPFHIHVNPMYVTRINGQAIRPYWCDTIALPAGGTPAQPTSITFRMRFVDFTGPYLLHCQMLQHSDLGMIQRVTVVPV